MLTLRRNAWIAAVALILVPRATAQEDVLTPQDVANLQSVSTAKISPDGKHVAFTRSVPRTMDEDDGSSWSELWLLDLETGRERGFITGEVSIRSVGWTPDGEVSFLSKREGDDHTALHVIPVDGGEARRIAQLESSISGYSFSPDGTEVALVAREPKSKEQKALEKKGFKQQVYEEDWLPGQVWIAKPGSDDDPTEVELEGHVSGAQWSPVDDRLLVVAAPTALVDDSYMKKAVHVVDRSGTVLATFERPGKKGQVAWSPDGAHIAMIGAEDLHDPSAGRLLVAPADGGEWVDLLPDYPGQIDHFEWMDADDLLYVASRGVWTNFERVNTDEPGAPAKVIVEKGPVLRTFSLTDDGMAGAFVASAWDHTPELYTMSHGDDDLRRRTHSNPWLADKRLAKQQVVRFAARDGVELEGVLIRPLDEVAGQRYPLILYVHGGPEAHDQSGWVTYYSRPGQVAAAEGYAVFYINYRGSTGRGVEFSKSSQSDFAGKEFDDLVDAADHLAETGLVDRDKVGVTGGSYGGFATAWCSTALSEHFAAGVMFVGISNNLSKVGTSDIPDEMYLVHHRLRPWEDWQLFLERSPIYHADKGRTPLLILHGKDDPRVDNGQSRELYRHLKLRGEAPVRLVLYPGEGHGNRKRSARLDYSLRMMRWFGHYLQGDGGEPPHWQIDYELEAEVEEEEPVATGQ